MAKQDDAVLKLDELSLENLERDKIQAFLADIKEYILLSKPGKLELAKQKVAVCRKLKMRKIPTDIELLLNADVEDVPLLMKYLQTKPMRTASGVAVVAIMSAPSKCPHGKCIYCPGGIGSSFGDVPQSYTGNEPATMRGMRNNYDAYLQVMNRLEQYVAIGQSPEKVELIILGGTFMAQDTDYMDNFVRDAYKAMNDFSSKFYSDSNFKLSEFKEFFELPGDIKNPHRTLSVQSKVRLLKEAESISLNDAIRQNETSNIKCVGLTIETKPDWGMLEHGNKMLEYGCTRVELGIQSLNDEVLSKVNRGHGIEEAKRSIQELKDLGFKLNFHMMPGLPGSTKEKDIDCFKQLFDDESFRPDMLKIYPTMVMPGTILSQMQKEGKYKPLDVNDAVEIISEGLRYVPKYCRVMRIQRDIPAKFAEIAIANNNLRQMVSAELIRKNFKEQDIRSREIGRNEIAEPINFEINEYDSSGGKEYFISLVDGNDKLLGFTRLRLPMSLLHREITNETGIIRELHVYGTSVPIKKAGGNSQHKGFGKMLLAKAEEIAKTCGKNKIVVISGVGVREYYRKLGYAQEGPYVSKLLI